MAKSWMPWIVGLAIVFGLSFLFGLVETAFGVRFGFEKLLLAGLFGALIGYVVHNLSGNRPAAFADDATRAHALELAAPAGQAALYVYRTGLLAQAAGMNVEIDGKPFVQLKGPRFACLTIAPGPHRIRVAFGGGAGAQSNAAEVTIEASAGGIVILKASMTMGALKNSLKIEPVAHEDARRDLAGAQMVLPQGA